MKTNSLVSQVKNVLSHAATHLTPSEIAGRIHTLHSDSSITARIRDLRKKAYGAHTIDTKRLHGKVFGYRIVSDAVN